MKATVKHINANRGMVAALTEEGSYSIFELLGSDSVEIGDVVSWRGDTPLGGEPLRNLTQNSQFEVYFQNHHVHPDNLRQQLLYA
jgi:hypothetical protein